MNFDQPNKENMPLKIIEDKAKLEQRLDDARGQFLPLVFGLKGDPSFEELKNKLSSSTFLPIKEFLKITGYEISKSIEEDQECKLLLEKYDGLINRINNFQTIEEAKQIVEDSKFFARKSF